MKTEKNILLVIGDPYWPLSIYNKIIVDDLKKSVPGLLVSNLFELYPDYRILMSKQNRKS